MEKIKSLAKNIEEEICDAKKYAELAIDNKADDPSLADLYINLAKEEMEHAARLHDVVVGAVEKYRKVNGDPPERMLGRYEYMHEHYVNKAAEVKGMIAVYDMK